MEINNDDFGGFIVSKNVIDGKPIRYTYREKSTIPQLNGWTIYSIEDDDAYVNDSNNFVILSAESVYQIAPLMIQIFDAPYGTDLCWQYDENGNFKDFYDLTKDKSISLKKFIRKYLQSSVIN